MGGEGAQLYYLLAYCHRTRRAEGEALAEANTRRHRWIEEAGRNGVEMPPANGRTPAATALCRGKIAVAV